MPMSEMHATLDMAVITPPSIDDACVSCGMIVLAANA
jgi:hypothetical protein